MLVLNMEECICRLRLRLLARRCVGLVRVTAMYDLFIQGSSFFRDCYCGRTRSKLSVFLTSVC